MNNLSKGEGRGSLQEAGKQSAGSRIAKVVGSGRHNAIFLHNILQSNERAMGRCHQGRCRKWERMANEENFPSLKTITPMAG